MLKTQNLLRTTNIENFSSIRQTFSKYLFRKAKVTRFENTSFELTSTEILKIKLQYHKIQIPVKTILRFCFQNFRLIPALHFQKLLSWLSLLMRNIKTLTIDHARKQICPSCKTPSSRFVHLRVKQTNIKQTNQGKSKEKELYFLRPGTALMSPYISFLYW